MKGDIRAIFNKPDRNLTSSYRRGLYSATHLHEGKSLDEKDFLFCRPESELSPNDIEHIKGKKLLKSLMPYQPIESDLIL